MSVSPSLKSVLQRTLGEAPADELVTLLENTEYDALRADIAELRHEMRTSFVTLESRINERIETRTADLMKWSFVFWCGAVTAIAALAGVLRN